MSFLAPWFLLGGLAIGLPILFHLIRRVTRERVPFSSVLFLRPTPPKVKSRRRVEHILLLLLRCLCLILLAVAFARPFFSDNAVLPPMANESRQRLVLIDTSASMQRDGVWDRARSVAERYLADAGSADQIAVAGFDRSPATLLSFSEWRMLGPDQARETARQKIRSLQPLAKGTQLGLALMTAADQLRAEALAGTASEQQEIVLITDLQEGARLDGLQGFDWPPGVRVILETVSAAPGNAGVVAIGEARGSAGRGPLTARVINAADSRRERFELEWFLEPSGERVVADVYVPPGETRLVTGPAMSNAIRTARAVLRNDEASFDNTAWFALPEWETRRVLWVGSESPDDPARLRFYFDRVFASRERGAIEIVSAAESGSVRQDQLSDCALVVVTRSLADAEMVWIRNWLASGRSALMTLADDSLGPTLAGLSGVAGIGVSEADSGHVLFSEIDFQHPLFAPFADPRFSDFTKIHFWKHRRLRIPEESARVVARFDDGSPALAEFAVGNGTLLVLTSGWHPADSQLAVASKFPPLMQTLLAWADAGGPLQFQFQCGDAIASAESSGTVEWRLPGGEVQELRAGEPFVRTDVPGLYVARSQGQERHYAVNLPAEESRTAAMSVDALARLDVPLGKGEQSSLAKRQEGARHWHHVELENRQKLWRWLLVGALVFATAEMLLSGWLSRRATRVTEDTTGAATPSEGST